MLNSQTFSHIQSQLPQHAPVCMTDLRPGRDIPAGPSGQGQLVGPAGWSHGPLHLSPGSPTGRESEIIMNWRAVLYMV